jgi:hypothetical protein
MPQVGYGIRCYAITFRCPALFNFARCPNFKCRVSERKTAPRQSAALARVPHDPRPLRRLGKGYPAPPEPLKTKAARAGAVVSSDGKRRKCVRRAISDHKGRTASVRFPTINQKNPHYPQPGMERARALCGLGAHPFTGTKKPPLA